MLVLCHKAGAVEVEGYPGHPLLPLAELVDLYPLVALPGRRPVVACVALNTAHLDEAAARIAVEAAERETGLPTHDPVRFGTNLSARRNPRRPVACRAAPFGGGRPSRSGRTRVRSSLFVAAVTALAVAALAGTAGAADIGANDDTGKYAEDGGGTFFERMSKLGLRQTVMTVRYLPGEPDTIQGKAFLDKAVPEASRQGLKVVFAVYPYPPRSLARTRAEARAFAGYAARLAREYPDVRQFVIGNEPNQPAFWRPQLSAKGKALSAPAFGRYLAAAYDALKAVDPAITVVGVGLSPRGNDLPTAKSNVSTSPVRFLAALGAWYRRSGRLEPLMDGFSFHPYPRVASHPLTRLYDWPNAGYANLGRIKQAFWDAFHDTPQPTTVDGLRLYLNEVGWQVDTTGLEGYTGLENVTVTTEAKQAAIYADLVRRAACDPDIAEVNFFGFYDDDRRDLGFQAALNRRDGSARPSAKSVATAIKRTAARPCAKPVRWRPSTAVAGARLRAPRVQRSGSVRTLVGAKENASAVVCLVAAEPGARRIASVASLKRLAVAPCWRGNLTPRFGRSVKLDVPLRLQGQVVVAARISAQVNPQRFAVLFGTPSGP